MAFHGFESFNVKTQSQPEVVIHGVKSENHSQHLPTILLLHGFPQNLNIWHKVAPRLVGRYNVLALDLRGYGSSSKPVSSNPEDVSEYAKSKMAKDCAEVLKHFKIESVYVCAHDRGARVAHKLLVDYPKLVKRAIFLDICPTLAMYTKTDLTFATKYFHWFLLIQKAPLPEKAISANPREFATNFMGGRQADGITIFEKDNFDSYVHGLGDRETIHGMCQDYRASATLDLDEARSDLKNGRLIQCPLLVLWGDHGIIGKCFDAVQEWKDVAEKNVEIRGRAVDSGHYLPEQASEEVHSAILEWLS